MTDRQKELLYQLYNTYTEMVEEYQKDDNFRNVLDDNNDLLPMSMDELANEWFNVAEEERGK
jgi:hypothetical protein